MLVTGAAGFLGRAVVRALAGRGHSVTAFTRGDGAVPEGADRHVRGDVRDAHRVAEAVGGVDAVCHLAALTGVRASFAEPLEYWLTNVGGTVNVLAALGGDGGRLVVASTAAGRDSSPYAATKWAADRACADVAAAGGLGAVSLRAYNLAGPGDPDERRLIPKILAVAAGRGEFVVNGDGSVIRDFVHVEDMADAVVLALDACAAGGWRGYDIGSGRRTSVLEVVRVVEDVTGRAVPVQHAPAVDEPAVLVADPTSARRELGWRPARSDVRRIVEDAWRS
ncbi:NAD-dependent epimerase/dehydratase family protein [Actinophytocola xinjiangensis]|uniref:NAD-dependent epimerase/dehydratase family protein n=1 Tax=Actinophytocola xinjiangensis TaxID=485602 RepID=UPI0024829D21|nr:NAD-dependent epimerase/dehydratase family protein [Actinophytocola xinjiangensis]